MRDGKGKGHNPAHKRPVDDVADEYGMQIILQGDGVAVGEDTSTWIDADLSVVDFGKITFARGSIWVGAAAEASDEDIAFAIAEAEALAFGADRVHIKTEQWSYTDGDSTYELTILKVKAFDHEKLGGETKFKFIDKEMQGKFPGTALSGNEARLSFDAKVEGKDTFVSVDAFALAVEDALSQSSLLIIAEVG